MILYARGFRSSLKTATDFLLGFSSSLLGISLLFSSTLSVNKDTIMQHHFLPLTTVYRHFPDHSGFYFYKRTQSSAFSKTAIKILSTSPEKDKAAVEQTVSKQEPDIFYFWARKKSVKIFYNRYSQYKENEPYFQMLPMCPFNWAM